MNIAHARMHLGLADRSIQAQTYISGQSLRIQRIIWTAIAYTNHIVPFQRL